MVCLNVQSYFDMINGCEFKSDVRNLLEKHNVTDEEQQQNTSTFTQLLWKYLTDSWQNSCWRP